MNFDLDGKVAVVTGASAGIGRATARALAAEGARVVLVARRVDLLESLSDELQSSGAVAPLCVALDTVAESAGPTLRQAVEANCGAAHILVNSAGASWPAPLQTTGAAEGENPRPAGDYTEEEIWMKSLELNFHSNRRLTYALLPLMFEEGYGRVINITSSTEPGPMNASNPAKAAVHAWSKALSNEVGVRGVTVNCVAPGLILSEQVERAWDAASRERIANDAVPLKRFGIPDDVAGVVLYLAAPQGGYITGEIINVDGGLRRSASEQSQPGCRPQLGLAL